MKTSVSARIDSELVQYLNDYQKDHDVATRSEALELAIRALRDKQLQIEYALAMDEWQSSGDAEAWDQTAGDGVNHNEAW